MNERVAFQETEPDPELDEDGNPIVPVGDPEMSEEDKAWEERARRMGWRPIEEWRGDKSQWRNARDFVERGENNTPILIERMHKLERTNVEQQKQLTEANSKLAESTEVLKQLYAWAQRADSRAYERAVADLEAKSRLAVAEADTAAYDRAQSELAALEKGRDQVLPVAPVKPPEPPVPPEQPALDPVIAAWTRENAWWFQDPNDQETTEIAVSMFGGLKAARPTAPAQELLDEVLKRIKKMFPEKFMNQRRTAPAAALEPSAPSGRQRNSKEFGYDDLPKDAKQQCDKFVKNIPGFTKEAYTKEWIRQNGDTK